VVNELQGIDSSNAFEQSLFKYISSRKTSNQYWDQAKCYQTICTIIYLFFKNIVSYSVLHILCFIPFYQVNKVHGDTIILNLNIMFLVLF